ncbi:MAG: hypothetical protein VR64_11630 [Desulfatitalea sp. BRH_c12]|nr:MAG: hypothetical protein VR64_11630 [Desulfatitalea sp. BRH_c12]
MATWWVLNANVLNTSTCPTILFNVEVSEGLDREALMKGFRGVVHAHLPIDFYPRALSAVASGELWYPRKVLAQHFLSENMPYRKLLEKNSLLTEREKEILRMLSSGKSNQQIADYLSISQHTVKNHAYNIFKKLNVSNRLEAALWLSNHI